MDEKVLGSTVRIDLTTHDSTGALVAPSSAFAAADFRVYKDGSASEKTTTNGVTVTSPFDSITGKHLVEIDTSNATGDSGFWAAGSEYRVEVNSAKTISSVVQSGVTVGRFRLVSADTLRSLGSTAPADWINAAALAADAGQEIAAMVETYIVNEGDATAVMQALADKIAADWVAGDASPIAIASAVWGAATRTITGGSLTTSPPTAAEILTALDTGSWATSLASQSSVTQIINALPTSGHLAGSADAGGSAVLDSGALLGALGLEAGNLDEQLADILAASGGGGGGGGGGGFTEEQTALLVSIARWAARNNGGPMHYTGNVGDGGVLELTINDDHETAIENDLPIVVKDPDGLLHAKLTTSGATLSWSAGQDNVGGLITGTVTAPTHDEDTGLTTIVVQVPNCTAAGNITAPYQWQLKRTSGGKIKTELRGTLRINPDMS